MCGVTELTCGAQIVDVIGAALAARNEMLNGECFVRQITTTVDTLVAVHISQ